MQIKTDGLVIRETNVGEDDKFVTVLTRDKGVLRASAKGARKLKGRFSSVCRLLTFSRYTLFSGREKYIIDDAEPLDFFMGVRTDLVKLSLAQYFCELSGALSPVEEQAELYLRLILNALHLLESEKRPQELLKAVFEMRILTLSGYMPDLVACRNCGVYEDAVMYFFPQEGNLCCRECHGQGGVPLSAGALAALRHSVYADFEKLFSFTLSGQSLEEFAQAAEAFLLCRTERTFPTLEFYRGLR